MGVFAEYDRRDMNIICPPGTLTLSGKHLLALKEWSVCGHVVCCDCGWNGTVIANAPEKFVGVGHTEGGVETAVDFEISADGRDVGGFKTALHCSSAEYQRITMLDHLQLAIRTEVHPEEFFSGCSYLALADQNIELFYAHQYSWSTAFDRFRYQSLDGKWHEGTLHSRGEMIYWQRIRCAVLFAPAYGMAVAFAPDPASCRIATGKLWDRAIYHKFYLELDQKGVIPAWSKSPVCAMETKLLHTTAERFAAEAEKFADGLPALWEKRGFAAGE